MNDTTIHMYTDSPDATLPEFNDTHLEKAIGALTNVQAIIKERISAIRNLLGAEMASLRKENKRLADEVSKAREQLRIERTATALRVSDPVTCAHVLDLVAARRERQEAKFGAQDHPTGIKASPTTQYTEMFARENYDRVKSTGHMTWKAVLDEEVAELYNAADEDQVVDEALDVAAVALAMIESVLRKRGGK